MRAHLVGVHPDRSAGRAGQGSRIAGSLPRRDHRWLVGAFGWLLIASGGCLPPAPPRLPPTTLSRSVTFLSARALTVRWPASRTGPQTWASLVDVWAVGGEVIGLWTDTLLLKPTYLIRDTTGRGVGTTYRGPGQLMPDIVAIVTGPNVSVGAYRNPRTTLDVVADVVRTLAPGIVALGVAVATMPRCN